MRLRTLELNEFRSFRSLHLDIDPQGFRLFGANASGKSTILESVSLLATTRSPHTSSDRDLLNWESGRDFDLPPYARVVADFTCNDGNHRSELGLGVAPGGTERLTKQFRIDGQSMRAVDAVGQLTSVLFSPSDVSLIAGPPAARRRYLDIAISQAHRVYLKALSHYGRVLEQRNSLLRSLAKERNSLTSARARDQLQFWNEELAAAATEILAYRLAAVAELSGRARVHFSSLSGIGSFLLSYVSSGVLLPEIPPLAAPMERPSEPMKQAIAAQFAVRLQEAASEELRRGVSALGPHRDDFVVQAEGVDLGRFGSRGQQRLAVLAVKLAELELLEAARGETPILMLDDALSELDRHGRDLLTAEIGRRDAQVLMTATDADELRDPALVDRPLLQLVSGVVSVSS